MYSCLENRLEGCFCPWFLHVHLTPSRSGHAHPGERFLCPRCLLHEEPVCRRSCLSARARVRWWHVCLRFCSEARKSAIRRAAAKGGGSEARLARGSLVRRVTWRAAVGAVECGACCGQSVPSSVLRPRFRGCACDPLGCFWDLTRSHGLWSAYSPSPRLCIWNLEQLLQRPSLGTCWKHGRVVCFGSPGVADGEMGCFRSSSPSPPVAFDFSILGLKSCRAILLQIRKMDFADSSRARKNESWGRSKCRVQRHR